MTWICITLCVYFHAVVSERLEKSARNVPAWQLSNGSPWYLFPQSFDGER